MLTPSGLRQPALRLPDICCLWLFPSVVNLLTLHSAVRLKPNGRGQNSSWGWSFCFLSVCCSEGSGLPEQGGFCSMLRTQHWDPHGHSLSSLPQASIPSLSSNISSPLCPTPCLLPGICVCGYLLYLLI